MPPPHPGLTATVPLLRTSPLTLLSSQASLTGSHQITLGANSVIQVRARIVATYGPVTIGEGCIVSERASVGILTASHGLDNYEQPVDGSQERGREEEREEQPQDGVFLERGVVVETGAVIEAGFVGEGSVIEVGARVGRGSVIGKHCKIAPLCIVPSFTTLPDYTVIYGNNERRLGGPGLESLRAEAREKHIEVLKALAVTAGKTGRS